MRAAVQACCGALLAACGPANRDDAALGEICGGAEPFRVLEFPAGETLAKAEPVRLGDGRLMWSLSLVRLGDVNVPFRVEERSTWVAGPCGESPRRIEAPGPAWVEPTWPSSILAKDAATGEVLVFDPDGVRPSAVLFTDVGVMLGRTRVGWVSVAEQPARAALRLHRFPEDPWSGPAAAIDLLDAADAADGIGWDELVDVRDDEAWAVTADGTLVHVSLPDGEVTIEQADVRFFELSADGRWLAWQDSAVVDGDGEVPSGQLWLRDRTTGVDQPLWVGWLPFQRPLRWVDRGVVFVGQIPRLLPELAPAPAVPQDSDVLGPAQAGLWLGGRWAEHGTLAQAYDQLFTLDLLSGQTRVLHEGNSWIMNLREDGVEVTDAIPTTYPPLPTEAPLLWVGFDGASPHRLAERVSRPYLRFDDGRIVTPLHLDGELRGELVYVDPATLAEHRIDEDAFVAFGLHQGDARLWGDGVVLYSVADGERSGMWIARMPEDE